MVCVLSFFAYKDQLDSRFSIKSARYFLIYVALVICLGGLIFAIYELVRFFLIDEEY